MIAALYVRVSTEEQAERGYSLGHQREECRRRAFALGADEVREFADEGVSGAILDRPGLAALRAAVRARAVQLVVVYDPDRLARKLAYQLLVTDEIEAAQARLEFVNFEWRDTPEGQLFYALRGAVAQYEKEKIRERTMAGRRQKAKSGRMPAAVEPYGYAYDARRAALVVRPDEARVVRHIYHLLVRDGVGINGIARRLDQEGVPTRRGGAAWHRVVVRQILQNPVYTGTFYANRLDCRDMGLNRHLSPDRRRSVRVRERDEWIPVAVPSLVDAATWARAQEILSQARRLMHAHPRSDYLLSGLVTCGVCGLSMAGTRRGSWGTTVRGHTCRRAWAGAKQGGCGRFVRAEPIESAVWARVAAWVADPDALAAAVAADGEEASFETRDELRRVEDALRRAEQGRRNILSALERNLVTPSEGLETLDRVCARLSALHLRHAELRRVGVAPRSADVESLRARAARWLAAGGLDGLPLPQRRRLVRELVAEVRVDEGALVVRARVPDAAAGGGDGGRGADAPPRQQEDAQRGLPAGADRRRP